MTSSSRGRTEVFFDKRSDKVAIPQKPDALPKKGQEIGEMLATDVDLENEAITMYNEASVICSAEKDQKSKDLFEELLGEEEAHLHFFERIKNHIDKMGAAYIVTLTGKRQESA